MEFTFLGTGAAGGVPLYGCDCAACRRARSAAECRRAPCSALARAGETQILLDAGLTDLTERFPPGSLAAIVLTHFHADHVQGLFHLRWGKGAPIPVLAPPDSEGCADLYKHHGLLQFRWLAGFVPITLGELTLTPLPLAHSRPTFGYAIEDGAGRRFAYLTDTVGLPPRTEAFLKDWRPEAVAVDCTRPPAPEPPVNHNDLTRALDIARSVAPAATWLTHVSHELDCWLLQHSPSLPPAVAVARDGLLVRLEEGSADAAPC